MYTFDVRTGQISIDHEKCLDCTSLACVAACTRYGSRILKGEGGKPVLAITPEETVRRDIECLACELACYLHGQQALTISLPIVGLQQYRESAHGHPAG